MNRVLWPFNPRSRKIELQGRWVPMDEVKDSMPPCVHPRNKVRPRYRTLGRNAGSELAKIAQRLQFRKVRHLTLAHESMQELRIHAVNAQNDHALVPMPTRSRRPAGGQHRR